MQRTVVFTAPHNVTIQTNAIPTPPATQVLVKTTHTAISTGTELLFYHGKVPTSIPTDAIFPTQTTPQTYPTTYGYSLVGNITTPTPPAPLTPNQSVFAFREHTSHICTTVTSLLPIPPNISHLDAVFLPFIETAISLATDAALLPGESVCIIGQGTIGLLLLAVLTRLHPYSPIHTIDPSPIRRALSSTLSPTTTHSAPTTPPIADVSIEVSGSPTGLQSAIASTRDHGRVIIGSWYGTTPVTISNLGARFHRSHISLLASQVSSIPPALTPRWTKTRRFNLAWRLLADIKPSTLLPLHIVDVNQAPQAYEQLAAGQHLQVIFRY